ncbi:MAG: peptidylprolyl isomerase [Bacteroidales bacterium]
MNSNAEQQTYILIETHLGNIKLVLYNDTPLHRDNFIKLANEAYFDDTIFHRVIKGFMVQSGDPDSKNAPFTQQLGAGGPGYTIPAEIIYPKYFHKRGALAAARQADRVNPEKRSSGSQFYIVWGSILSNELLDNMEKLTLEIKQEKIFNEISTQYNSQASALLKNEDHDSFQKLQNELSDLARAEADKTPNFKYSAEERLIYTTLGGSPFLDNEYSVFGEVVEGLEVVDLIQNVRVGVGDRPLEDIKIKVTVVNE